MGIVLCVLVGIGVALLGILVYNVEMCCARLIEKLDEIQDALISK